MDDKAEVSVAALARPFHLGMLYDQRRDALIPAITLWDPEDLKEVLSTIIAYHHGNTGADPEFFPRGGVSWHNVPEKYLGVLGQAK